MGTDLSAFKKNDRKALKPTGKGQGKGGRPLKNPGDRMNEKVTLNFTKREKEKLLELSQEKGNLPLTILIRNLLIENNYI